MKIELEKQIVHDDSVTINNKPLDPIGQLLNGFFWKLGASLALILVCVVIGLLKSCQSFQ